MANRKDASPQTPGQGQPGQGQPGRGQPQKNPQKHQGDQKDPNQQQWK